MMNDSEPNLHAKPRHDISAAEGEINQILTDSFPSSDAPPWTLGVTETLGTRVGKSRFEDGSVLDKMGPSVSHRLRLRSDGRGELTV